MNKYREQFEKQSGRTVFDGLDGEYIKWLENKLEAKDELIQALEEYIKLLGEELNDTVVMLSVHGWKSKRVEQGQLLREKINKLKEKAV